MAMQEYGLLIDGEWVTPNGTREVRSPYTGEPVFRVSTAGEAEVQRAIDAATRAFTGWSETPAHERSAILHRAADLLGQRREDLARTIALEGGKPIRDARAEVSRGMQTFRFAAEEAKQSYGETIPMDAALGSERVILELGSNSATIVHRDADLDAAARALAKGAFAYAGQICISVQRIIVHEDVQQRFLSLFLPLVQALKVGDPLSEDTDVGPMIDAGSADRGEAWIKEALAGGARALVEGKRDGTLMWPWVLTDVRPEMKIVCEEAFAPVVTIQSYGDFDQAIDLVNDSQFGLQAGVFTNDLNLAFRAGKRIRTGGVIVNDTSNYRVDHMPYGGLKLSGMGREGVRYTMAEMTELKLIAFNLS